MQRGEVHNVQGKEAAFYINLIKKAKRVYVMYTWVSALHKWLKTYKFSVIILKFVILPLRMLVYSWKSYGKKTQRLHTLPWNLNAWFVFDWTSKVQSFKPLTGGRNSSLVVFGLAVHSVAGSILLWGHFPVEGIFPLELTWVQTPFPQKLFRMRV